MSERITIGYVSRGQGAGPLVVTSRAGLFEAEGLDVDVRFIEGSVRQSAALVSGELLLGNMAAAGMLPAVAGGADLVFVTGGINQQFVVARPGVGSLAELAGGTIAVRREGELNDLLARIVDARMIGMGLNGLRRRTGVEPSECQDELVAGRIDCAVLSPPSANEARRLGCSFVLDLGNWGLNFTLGGLAATRRTVEERGDLVQRVVRAYVAGMHRYKTDREFAVASQHAYSGIAERTIAEEVYATTEPGMPRAPYPVTSGLEVLLDAYRQVDPRADTMTAAALIDDRFVRALDESGFIDRLYA